jgi:hypothetical protein
MRKVGGGGESRFGRQHSHGHEGQDLSRGGRS